MQIVRNKLKSESLVMAIGVGGGGINAVNYIYTSGLAADISYFLFNTDRQSLKNSPIHDDRKLQIGKDGLGAGNDASRGRAMAEESADLIEEKLSKCGVKMVFVVAGMGGGTGTGAAPVIAHIAKELGILTIGVVTIPFESEGRPRLEQAISGVEEMSRSVDSLIIINNSHIVEMYGHLSLSKAYDMSNDIISKAVKSISDIINKNYIVNVDFADVCKVMRDSGVALMGTGRASGPQRSLTAVREALCSPLLHMQDISGAANVLVTMISSSDPKYELKMSDARNVPAYIQQETKNDNLTDIIWGAGYDDDLGEDMQVVVIATGFNLGNLPSIRNFYKETFQQPQQPQQPQQSRQASHGVKVKFTKRTRQPEQSKPDTRSMPSEPVAVSNGNESVFYDVNDTVPAFKRRNVQFSRFSQDDADAPRQRRRKSSLVVDEEPQEEKKTHVKTPSLFD